MRIIINSQV